MWSQITPNRMQPVPSIHPNMHHCHKVGHFAKVCRSKGARQLHPQPNTMLASCIPNQIQWGHSQPSQLISHYYLVSTMTYSPIQHRQSLSKSTLPMAQTLWRCFLTLGLTYQQLALRPCATSTNTLTTCYHPALFLELPMALKCTLSDDFLSRLILKTGPIRQTCTSSQESTTSCHRKPAKHLGFCHRITHNHHPRHNPASKLYHYTPTQLS